MKSSNILMLLNLFPLLSIYFAEEKDIQLLVIVSVIYFVGTILAFEIEKLREEIKKCQ